jgi:hypothetical protein
MSAATYAKLVNTPVLKNIFIGKLIIDYDLTAKSLEISR